MTEEGSNPGNDVAPLRASRGDWVAEVTATVATAISSLGLAIALAALIFTGPIEAGLSRATTNFVLVSAIAGLIVGVRGRFRPTISIIQDGPAVVLVTVVAGLSSAESPTGAIDAFALIGVATLVTAAAMLAIGHFGVGGVVRYFPTAVISGFIAGTGYLLVKGGLDVMLDRTIEFGDLGTLIEPDVAKYWLPGLALGVVMQILASMPRCPKAVLGLVVLGGVGAFFAVGLSVSTLSELEDANWLIGPFPDGAGIAPLTPGELADVDWAAVLASSGGILAAAAVSVVAILLNLSGLETITGDRLDAGRELQSAGVANLVSAPFGVVASFQALGDTTLARQMGARSNTVPIGVFGIGTLIALFGSRIIGLTPRVIAGGLLVAVGFALAASWIDTMRTTTSRTERALSASIPISIAVVGILEGITLGLVAACLLFVVRYSRVDPVKRQTTAADVPSRVVRSADERSFLDDAADRVAVFQLNGYQFFGSFTSVVERVRQAAESAQPSLHAVVIDFRFVSGIDASALILLEQLGAELAGLEVDLVLSDLDPELTTHLRDDLAVLVDGLDFAVELAENQLLDAMPTEPVITPFASLSPALVEQLTRRQVTAGTILIEQASDGAALFLVLSGDLIVTRRETDGALHRLRRIGPGAIVGEHSLLLGSPRSAEVSAATDVEVYQVTLDDYDRLRRLAPKLAIELQDHLLAELARRSASLSEHLSKALR